MFYTIISIHAPREGSDVTVAVDATPNCIFLSTLPARGATPCRCNKVVGQVGISIHAPREGSDRRSTRKRVKSARNFYPRSPRGERRQR